MDEPTKFGTIEEAHAWADLRDELWAKVNRQQAEIERLRHCDLEQWGTLTCIREWLRGDLPEATRAQFIAMIDALESDGGQS